MWLSGCSNENIKTEKLRWENSGQLVHCNVKNNWWLCKFNKLGLDLHNGTLYNSSKWLDSESFDWQMRTVLNFIHQILEANCNVSVKSLIIYTLFWKFCFVFNKIEFANFKTIFVQFSWPPRANWEKSFQSAHDKSTRVSIATQHLCHTHTRHTQRQSHIHSFQHSRRAFLHSHRHCVFCSMNESTLHPCGANEGEFRNFIHTVGYWVYIITSK